MFVDAQRRILHCPLWKKQPYSKLKQMKM